MRKLKYNVEINGVTFEAKHGQRLHHIPELTGATRLDEVFYNEMNDAEHCSFMIASHNCMMFTLQMVIYDKERNQYWFLYITPCHNRAIKIDAE